MRSIRCKVIYVNLTLSITLVILFHDAFITFDREVACVWKARLTGASLLFFANRWITVMLYAMSLISLASFPSDKVSSLDPGCRHKLTRNRGWCIQYHFWQIHGYIEVTVDVCSCSWFQRAVEAILVLQNVPGAGESCVLSAGHCSSNTCVESSLPSVPMC